MIMYYKAYLQTILNEISKLLSELHKVSLLNKRTTYVRDGIVRGQLFVLVVPHQGYLYREEERAGVLQLCKVQKLVNIQLPLDKGTSKLIVRIVWLVYVYGVKLITQRIVLLGRFNL